MLFGRAQSKRGSHTNVDFLRNRPSTALVAPFDFAQDALLTPLRTKYKTGETFLPHLFCFAPFYLFTRSYTAGGTHASRNCIQNYGVGVACVASVGGGPPAGP